MNNIIDKERTTVREKKVIIEITVEPLHCYYSLLLFLRLSVGIIAIIVSQINTPKLSKRIACK